MRSRSISLTFSWVFGFLALLLTSAIGAFFELRLNFPEKLNHSFFSDLESVLTYWLGWVMPFSWFIIIVASIPLGLIIHLVRYLILRLYLKFKR